MSAGPAVQAPTHGIVADEAAEAKRVPDPVAKLRAYAEVPCVHIIVNRRLPIFAICWRARSRLYQSRCLQKKY